MWSLPDIERLNAEAASATARNTILKAIHQHLDSLGNPIHCDYCANEVAASIGSLDETSGMDICTCLQTRDYENFSRHRDGNSAPERTGAAQGPTQKLPGRNTAAEPAQADNGSDHLPVP